MFTRFRSLLREGLMMSVALYSHKPKKFRFFQAVNGLQMWRAAGLEVRRYGPVWHTGTSLVGLKAYRHFFLARRHTGMP